MSGTAFATLLLAGVIASTWLAFGEKSARERADHNAALRWRAPSAPPLRPRTPEPRLVAEQLRQNAESERKLADAATEMAVQLADLSAQTGTVIEKMLRSRLQFRTDNDKTFRRRDRRGAKAASRAQLSNE